MKSHVIDNVELSTPKLGNCYVRLTPLTPTQCGATAYKTFMGTNASKKFTNRLTNIKATSASMLSNVYLKTFGIKRLKICITKIQTKQG